MYEWSLNDILADSVADPTILAALIAIGALDFLVLTSVSTMRERSYRLFFASHIVGIFTFGGAVHMLEYATKTHC